MSSAVNDLQRAILGGQQSLTQLLRQTKVIAAKLNLEDVERWADLELNGYPKDIEPPQFRQFGTNSVEYNNPYQGGWRFAGHINIKVPARQPIAEIEDFSRSERGIYFPAPKNLPLYDMTGEPLGFEFPQRITVAASQFARIIDAVTNELLRVTTELEKRGIKGENMNFDEKEKQTAGHMTFNIGTVQGGVGNISNSPITINSNVRLYDYSSIQQLLIDRKIPKQDRRELEDIMDELTEAQPEKKPSLLVRAEKWIVKHKELLGTGAELVGKAIGSVIEHTQKH
jgi:hypothetical protein